MAVMWGADADELDDLGRRMAQAADLLDTIRHEVSAALGRASWEGDDAADFHGLWSHRLSGLLQTTTNATRDASARLHRNAAEQRRTSSTDSGNPTRTVPGPGTASKSGGVDLGKAWDYLSLAGGAIVFGLNDLKLFKGVTAVDALTKERWLFGLGKDATGLKGVVHAADHLGPLALIGAGVDGGRLGAQLAQHKYFERDTLDAGVDLGFDIAEAATLATPAFVPVTLAHLAFDGYEALPDDVHKEIEGAVVNAAKEVVHVHVEAVKAEVHAVKAVAGAAGHVVSGGVHAVKNILGL